MDISIYGGPEKVLGTLGLRPIGMRAWLTPKRILLYKRSSIQTRRHELFQPASMDAFELQYDFEHVGVHVYSVMSPGKMIFAVLEL